VTATVVAFVFAGRPSFLHDFIVSFVRPDNAARSVSDIWDHGEIPEGDIASPSSCGAKQLMFNRLGARCLTWIRSKHVDATKVVFFELLHMLGVRYLFRAPDELTIPNAALDRSFDFTKIGVAYSQPFIIARYRKFVIREKLALELAAYLAKKLDPEFETRAWQLMLGMNVDASRARVSEERTTLTTLLPLSLCSRLFTDRCHACR